MKSFLGKQFSDLRSGETPLREIDERTSDFFQIRATGLTQSGTIARESGAWCKCGDVWFYSRSARIMPNGALRVVCAYELVKGTPVEVFLSDTVMAVGEPVWVTGQMDSLDSAERVFDLNLSP